MGWPGIQSHGMPATTSTMNHPWAGCGHSAHVGRRHIHICIYIYIYTCIAIYYVHI